MKMKFIQRIKRAGAILTGTEARKLDITIIKSVDKIPPKLYSTLNHRNVTREFLTEEDMEDPRVLRAYVSYFLRDFGMDPAVVKCFVLLIRDPQTGWGKGFPFQVKIYIFPYRLWKIEKEYADHPDFSYIWAMKSPFLS